MFKIRTNTRELIFRDEKEEHYFDLCCRLLLGTGTGRVLEKQDKSPEAEPQASPAYEEGRKSITELAEEYGPKRKVSGFLHIVCGHCGKEKSFCAKERLSHYICNECGRKTELDIEGLRRMWVNCECGRTSTYLTNSTEGAFDIACVDCGTPVAVEWNSKKKCYMTIK